MRREGRELVKVISKRETGEKGWERGDWLNEGVAKGEIGRMEEGNWQVEGTESNLNWLKVNPKVRWISEEGRGDWLITSKGKMREEGRGIVHRLVEDVPKVRWVRVAGRRVATGW